MDHRLAPEQESPGRAQCVKAQADQGRHRDCAEEEEKGEAVWERLRCAFSLCPGERVAHSVEQGGSGKALMDCGFPPMLSMQRAGEGALGKEEGRLKGKRTRARKQPPCGPAHEYAGGLGEEEASSLRKQIWTAVSSLRHKEASIHRALGGLLASSDFSEEVTETFKSLEAELDVASQFMRQVLKATSAPLDSGKER